MVLSATISSTHVETGIRIDAGSLASTTTQLTVFLTTEHDTDNHNDPADETPEDGQLVLNDPKHGNLIYSMPLPLGGNNSSLIIPASDLIEGIDYTVALEVVGTDPLEEGIVQLENVRYIAPPTITNEVFTVQVGDQALFIGIANENTAIEGFKIYINGKFSEAPNKYAYKTVVKTVDGETGRYLLASQSSGRVDSINLVNNNTYEVSYRKYITDSTGNKIYSAMSSTLAATPQAVAANPPQDVSIVVGKTLIDDGYTVGPTDQTFVTVFQEGVPAENYPFTAYIFAITVGASTIYAEKNVDTSAGGEALLADLQDPSKNYLLFDVNAFTYYDTYNPSTGALSGNVINFNTIVLDGTNATCTIYSKNGSGISTGSVSNVFVTSGLPAQVTVLSVATGEANVPGVDMNKKVRVTFTPPDANGSAITAYKFKIAGGNISVPTYITKVPADLTIDGGNRYIDFTQASDNNILEDLENGLSYTVTVRAINANGESVESGPSQSFIPSTKPSAPTGLVGIPQVNSISTLNSGEIKLDWTNTDNQTLFSEVTNGSAITQYVLKVYQTGVGQVGANITVDDVINTHTVTGLTNGAEYTIDIYASNANGDSLATTSNTMVPSAYPTFTANTTALLTDGLRNTYIGLIDGVTQTFKVNIDGIDDSVYDGGYAITHYNIVVTSAGGDEQTVTVAAADIATTQEFSLTNAITITNNDYLYTLQVFPYNSVYGVNNGSTTASTHFTTTILDVNGGVSVALNESNTQTLDFAWSIYDFDAVDYYTEGTTFDLALLASVPTLQGDGYTIEYSGFTQQSTSSVAIVSGTTDYTRQYTNLEYGWKYKLQVTVNSRQYGADTNANLPAVTSPDASESPEGIPNDKPTIAVNETTGDLTISANGTYVSEVLVLSTNNDRTAVESYLSAVRSVSTASSGNPGVTDGQVSFNYYMDGVTKTEYVASVNINGNLGGDKSHLTIVENNKGVTLELNGTPLGLTTTP